MKQIIVTLFTIALVLPATMWAQCDHCKNNAQHNPTAAITAQSQQVVKLGGAGKENALNEKCSFTYNFDKKPKLGTSIIKVVVTDAQKTIVKDYEVTANAYMPTMRGAHDTGEVKMKANKKNELLLPINFIMGGEWEIELKFWKNGKVIYTGIVPVKI